MVSFIENICAPVKLVVTLFADQVKMKLMSQLIKRVSTVLQKLLKYFIGAALVKMSSRVFPVIFTLNLNSLESVIVAFG